MSVFRCSVANLRVGAYIDGFNVYYGGGQLCGFGAPGWRWLDLAALVERLISRNPVWVAGNAELHHIAYCTALVSGETNPDGRRRQKTYLSALRADERITVELGRFIMRKVRGDTEADGVRMTIVAPEEKGSDVNVASHLLIDVYSREIDAAILISNDSDLRLPVQRARSRVPTGTVNPRGRPTAADLKGDPGDGVGGHWWYRLKADDFYRCQLPDVVGDSQRPPSW